MSSNQPRGPYAKGVAKRQEILSEALQAYAESGHTGPSLVSIAARTGLSERGLLHYFSSRGELLTSILAERDALARSAFDADDPVDILLDVVASQLATPGLTRLFLELAAASSDPTHPAHELFVGRYLRLIPLIQQMLDASMDQQPTPTDPGSSSQEDLWAARMLVAAADGLQIQWLLNPELDPRSDLERLGRLIQGSGS